MPVCTKCGKEYSVWTAKLGTGTCNDCLKAAAREVKEQSFACKIADVPLNTFDSLHRGAISLGTDARNFRDAAIQVVEGELRLSARDHSNSKVEVAKLTANDIKQVTSSPIRLGSQVSASLVRALGVGAGIGITIFIIVLTRVNFELERDLGKAVALFGGTLLAGLVIGFLFNFVPSLFQLHEDLLGVTFHTKDSRVIPIALTREQRQRAFQMLQSVGLVVEEKAAPAEPAAAPDPPATSPQ